MTDIAKKMMDLALLRSILNPTNHNDRITFNENPLSMQLLSSLSNASPRSSELRFWNWKLMKKEPPIHQKLAINIPDNISRTARSITDTTIKIYLNKSQRRGLLGNVDRSPDRYRNSMGVPRIRDRKKHNSVEVVILHSHEHCSLKNSMS